MDVRCALEDSRALTHHTSISMVYVKQWDFRGWERQPLSLEQKPIVWQDFFRKLHETERNWTGEGRILG